MELLFITKCFFTKGSAIPIVTELKTLDQMSERYIDNDFLTSVEQDLPIGTPFPVGGHGIACTLKPFPTSEQMAQDRVEERQRQAEREARTIRVVGLGDGGDDPDILIENDGHADLYLYTYGESAKVNLSQLILWLRENKPELLETEK
jgi:hypothetical protein